MGRFGKDRVVYLFDLPHGDRCRVDFEAETGLWFIANRRYRPDGTRDGFDFDSRPVELETVKDYFKNFALARVSRPKFPGSTFNRVVWKRKKDFRGTYLNCLLELQDLGAIAIKKPAKNGSECYIAIIPIECEIEQALKTDDDSDFVNVVRDGCILRDNQRFHQISITRVQGVFSASEAAS